MVGIWDTAQWDRGAEWSGGPPPSGGWGDDWRWWYQVGPTVNRELNEMIVEARWTTDGHTLGDGTFRGDIQPGSLTVRLWDPNHVLDDLPKAGAMWAQYKPTGATWCWFYDSFTRGLVAPGDPAGADCVFSGTQWPLRFTTWTQFTNYPAQSAAARLAAVVATLNAQAGASALNMPAVAGNIAPQTQLVPAAPLQQQPSAFQFYPAYLQTVRDAATNGIAWMSAAAQSGGRLADPELRPLGGPHPTQPRRLPGRGRPARLAVRRLAALDRRLPGDQRRHRRPDLGRGRLGRPKRSACTARTLCACGVT